MNAFEKEAKEVLQTRKREKDYIETIVRLYTQVTDWAKKLENKEDAPWTVFQETDFPFRGKTIQLGSADGTSHTQSIFLGIDTTPQIFRSFKQSTVLSVAFFEPVNEGERIYFKKTFKIGPNSIAKLDTDEEFRPLTTNEFDQYSNDIQNAIRTVTGEMI